MKKKEEEEEEEVVEEGRHRVLNPIPFFHFVLLQHFTLLNLHLSPPISYLLHLYCNFPPPSHSTPLTFLHLSTLHHRSSSSLPVYTTFPPLLEPARSSAFPPLSAITVMPSAPPIRVPKTLILPLVAWQRMGSYLCSLCPVPD